MRKYVPNSSKKSECADLSDLFGKFILYPSRFYLNMEFAALVDEFIPNSSLIRFALEFATLLAEFILNSSLI